MSEWGVVGVIVVLIGLMVSVMTPILKLNSAIVKLTTVVERLDRNLCELKTSNSESHEKIFGRLNEDEKQLENHEGRISRLEKQ